MSGFGLTPAQEAALVILHEDKEIIRDPADGYFYGPSRTKVGLSTVTSLFDRRMVRVFVKNHGPSRQPRFSATLSAVGLRIVQALNESSGQVSESASRLTHQLVAQG